MTALVGHLRPVHSRRVPLSKRPRQVKRLFPPGVHFRMNVPIVESKKPATNTRNRAPFRVLHLPPPRWCRFRRRILPPSRHRLRRISVWNWTAAMDRATNPTLHIPPATKVTPTDIESTPTVVRFTDLPRPRLRVFHQQPLFRRSPRTIVRCHHRLHPPTTHRRQ